MQKKYDKPIIQIIVLKDDCIRTSNSQISSGLQNGGEYNMDTPQGGNGWGGLFNN